MYEIVWTRMLSLTFGNTYLAISTVVASFMGGLGFGSILGGRYTASFRKKLNVYAYLEIGIGIYAVLTPFFFYNMGGFNKYISNVFGYESAFYDLVRFSAVFVILLLPTLLMGASLPLLCQHFIVNLSTLKSRIGHLYSVNTLGAALGALLTGFLLVEKLGNSNTIYLTAAINILIGLAVLLMRPTKAQSTAASTAQSMAPLIKDNISSSKKRSTIRTRPSTRSNRSTTAAIKSNTIMICIIFGISGYVSMSLEVIWIRAFRYFISNSTYAFSLIIMVFLFGIGTGSLVGSKMIQKAKSHLILFGLLEELLGCVALLSVPLLTRVFYQKQIYSSLLFSSKTFFGLTFSYFVTIVSVLFIPALIMGILFPVVSYLYTKSISNVGRSVGILYFVNTTGTILGSLAGGFLLLPLLGINSSIVLQSLIVLVCGLFVILTAEEIRGRYKFYFVLIPSLIFLIIYSSVQKDFVFNGLYEAPHKDVIYYDEGEMSTVKVFDSLDGIKIMSVDGNSIGSSPFTQADMKQRLIAHLPMLIKKTDGDVLSIGLGTGITTGCFTLYPEINKIHNVEIVPGVIEGAKYFQEENRGIFYNSMVTIQETDALNYLQVYDRTYDLIASDGKLNPLYSGNTVFLCKEFYQLCRARLKNGGILSQWINCSMPTREFLIVLKTISEVFPHVSIFYYPPSNIFFVAGNESIKIDLTRVDGLLSSRQDILSDISPYFIDNVFSVASGFIGESGDFKTLFEDLPINSWDRSVVEFESPRKWLESPKSKNLAGLVTAFMQFGVNAGDEERLRSVFSEPDMLYDEDWEYIERYFHTRNLLMEALISYLTSSDQTQTRKILNSVLQLDPQNRRAKAWLKDPGKHITF